MGVSIIDEYRKTEAALFSLLEKKQALYRKMRWDIETRSDLNQQIGVIKQEIYETQETLCRLERRERDDGTLHYGYRRRGIGGVLGTIDSTSDLLEIAEKTCENEKAGECLTE